MRAAREWASRLVTAGVLGLVGVVGAPASAAVVLLNDSFNANTPNTFDLNVDLARQSGAAAPIGYTMAFGPGQCCGHQLQNINAPNQLLLADFPFSTSALNYDFGGSNAAGGLKISFDLDPLPALYGSTDLTQWGCINVGMAAGDRLVDVNGSAPHFGVLFRANGRLQAFDGSSIVTPVPEPAYTLSPGGMHHLELLITDGDGNPFDGVGDTLIEVFADGSPLPVFAFAKTGGYANNYLNLQGFFRAHFDNLIITRLAADRPPEIIAQPQGQMIALGAPVQFTVGAAGAGPLSYQWRLNGVNIPSATGPVYELPGTGLGDGGSYSVVVSDDSGAVVSVPALLLFSNVDDGPPSLSDSFEDRGDLGQNSVRRLRGNNCDASRQPNEPFHAGKSGGKSVWYRWTAPADGIAVFRTRGSAFDTLLAVYTGTSLQTLRLVVADDDGGGFGTSEVRFNAVAGRDYAIAVDGKGGSCGTFLLDWDVELTGEKLPIITTQPRSRTVLFGDPYAFLVKASGTNVYQWFFNDQPIPEATAVSLRRDRVRPEDVGFYKVRVTDVFTGRFVESRTAILEIGPVPEVQSVAKPEDLLTGPEAGGSGGGAGGGALALPFQPASDFNTAPRIPVPRGGVGRQIWNNAQGSATFLQCGVRPTATRWLLLSNAPDGLLVIDTRGSRTSAGEPIPSMLSVYRQDVTGLPVYQPQVGCAVTNDATGTYGSVRFFTRGNLSYWIAADGVNTNGIIQVNWVHCPWPLAIQPAASISVAVGRSVNLGINLIWNPSPDVAEPRSLFAWEHAQQRYLTDQPVRKLAKVQPADAGAYLLLVSNIAVMTNLSVRLDVDPALVTLSESTFDSLTDEGWQTGGGKPEEFSILLAPDLHCGYLARNPPATNWVAPIGFLGNQSAAAGGQLQFDLRLPSAIVLLSGHGLTLEFRTNAVASPAAEWVSYRIPLTAGDWMLNGRPATALELLRVLSDVTRLEIGSVLPSGGSAGGELDNVALLGPSFDAVPYLVIRALGTNRVRIEWPLAADAFGLEATRAAHEPNGAASSWTPVPAPYGTSAPYRFLVVTNSGADWFYRLRKPALFGAGWE